METRRQDPPRGAAGVPADESVIGPPGAGAAGLKTRRPSGWPLFGLVGALIVLFTGASWFIHGMVREALAGAPPALAVIAPTPRPAGVAGTPQGGGVCAQCYPDEAQAARILRDHREAEARMAAFGRPNGGLRIEVASRLRAGRLLVLVDGRTALSKPFLAGAGDLPARVSHLLSVSAGQRTVRVRLIDERGILAADSATEVSVENGQIARLTAMQPAGGRGALELSWASDNDAGGR